MPEVNAPQSGVAARVLSALSWPLKRLRKFVTQRVENELRAEIAALSAQVAGSRIELADLREHARGLEIVIAGSHRWRASAPVANACPLFSIVMPTRNRRELIIDAVDSVLAQTFADWELLIVDDGSTDGTHEALSAYLADPRIRYCRRDAGGIAAARNTALDLARGALIAYLDSDNAWFPGFLAGMRVAFAGDNALQSAYAVLVTDADMHNGSPLLWKRFDPLALQHGNYIDINVFVHRRALLQRLGGFDEELLRLCDWDLILRYTRDGGCSRVAVAGALYRSRVDDRISDTQSFGNNWFRIQRKLAASSTPHRAPRVLYAVWHYPQLSETYIETEILAMRRFGADIRVWSNDDVAVPYRAVVPVRRGTLEQAIADFKPDVVHVHWVSSALHYGLAARVAGLPLTVRGHGFEVTSETIAQLLQNTALRQLVLFPQQAKDIPQADPRIVFAKAPFDTGLFSASATKDRRMVLRTSAALPSKDLRLFLEAAKRLPQHRFVLIACTAYKREDHAEELKALKAELDSPAELHFDMPREQLAGFMREAGIFLHTALGPDMPGYTPIGMPVSIAEAMATGAYVIARDLPELRDYVGPAGDMYTGLEQACALIQATLAWSDRTWRAAEVRSIDRAFLQHADEIVLRPLYECWVQLLQERHRPDRA